MTIDEYLGRLLTAKRESNALYKRLIIASEKALNVNSPGNIGAGTPHQRTTENKAEKRLLNYIDLHNEYSREIEIYTETRKQILKAIDYLLYWQGSLIYQVYIYNVTFDDRDELDGANEIVHTNSRRAILAKLAEAKEALADQLRAQGVEIEQRTITENGKTNN